LDIGVLGYIGIVQHKEHSPEVLSIPPGTPCICILYILVYILKIYFKECMYSIFVDKLQDFSPKQFE